MTGQRSHSMKAWLEVALADLPSDVKWRFESEYRDHVADAAPVDDVAALLGDPEQVNRELLTLYVNDQTWSELNDRSIGAVKLMVIGLGCLIGMTLAWPQWSVSGHTPTELLEARLQIGLYGLILAGCVWIGFLRSCKRELVAHSFFLVFVYGWTMCSHGFTLIHLWIKSDPTLGWVWAALGILSWLWMAINELRSFYKKYPALNRTLRLIGPE